MEAVDSVNSDFLSWIRRIILNSNEDATNRDMSRVKADFRNMTDVQIQRAEAFRDQAIEKWIQLEGYKTILNQKLADMEGKLRMVVAEYQKVEKTAAKYHHLKPVCA